MNQHEHELAISFWAEFGQLADDGLSEDAGDRVLDGIEGRIEVGEDLTDLILVLAETHPDAEGWLSYLVVTIIEPFWERSGSHVRERFLEVAVESELAPDLLSYPMIRDPEGWRRRRATADVAGEIWTRYVLDDVAAPAQVAEWLASSPDAELSLILTADTVPDEAAAFEYFAVSVFLPYWRGLDLESKARLREQVQGRRWFHHLESLWELR